MCVLYMHTVAVFEGGWVVTWSVPEGGGEELLPAREDDDERDDGRLLPRQVLAVAQVDVVPARTGVQVRTLHGTCMNGYTGRSHMWHREVGSEGRSGVLALIPCQG